jgi:hypothetical protein
MAIAIGGAQSPCWGRRNGGCQERMRGEDWKAPGLAVPGLDVPGSDLPGSDLTARASVRRSGMCCDASRGAGSGAGEPGESR